MLKLNRLTKWAGLVMAVGISMTLILSGCANAPTINRGSAPSGADLIAKPATSPTPILTPTRTTTPPSTTLPAEGSTQSPTWAGYVALSSFDNPQPVVTSIKGSWVVQVVPSTLLPSYSSQWIGIGGFLPNNQQNLIQTGTASLGVAGGNDYYAWYETLGTFPAAPYRLTNQVKSGDVMRAQISLTDSGTSQWNITISDSTQNWSVSNLVTYNSSEDTADWIEEHQFAIIGPLANFGTAQFGAQYTSASDTNYATIGNAPAPIAQLNRCQVSMVEGNVSIAQPSEISSDGTSFTVNRLATATPTPVPSNTSQVTIDSVLALNATDAATLSNTSVNGSSTYPQRAITTISSIPQPWLQVITLNSSFNDPQSLVSFFGFQTKTNLLPLSTSKAYAYSGFFYNGSTVVPFTAITDYVVVNPNDLQLVEWLDLGGEIASGENPEIIRLDIEKMIFEKAIETVSESETTIKQFEADIVSAYLDLASSSGGSSVATTSPFTSGTVILGTPTIPPLPGTAVTIPTTSPPTIGLPKPTTISNLPLPSALQLPSQAAPGK